MSKQNYTYPPHGAGDWDTQPVPSGGLHGILDDLDTRVGVVEDVNATQGGVLPIVAPTASYTLILADAGRLVRMNVATANTVTVPANTSVAFPTGAVVSVMQYGAGQTTIAAASGVTIRAPGGNLAVAVQYGRVELVKLGTNEWGLEGNLA